MEIIPNLRTAQLAQVNPGDLLIIPSDAGSYVAVAVKDPYKNERLVLLLGPASIRVPNVPILTEFPLHTPVISFSKDYALRLPCDVTKWFPSEPAGGQCIVVSGDSFYVRASYGWAGQTTKTYISLKDGLLLADTSGRFLQPRDKCAYAVEWALLTVETRPRIILLFQ
jgi:hypothetical protein